MMRARSRGARLAVASLACASLAAAPAPAPERVRTQAGPVEGFALNGNRAYLGIPFAAPPIGARRWQAPQPPAPWTPPLRAIRYRPACPQSDTLGTFAAPSSEEDCLYLNVFVPPHRKGAALPVMFWIYGGGLRAGAAQDYDPTALAREGVIVVTFNYRMGVLGYYANPALGADNRSPNYGLLDQIAALRWVKDNIAGFDGDPANVTIFGESAGARSVGALLASPAATDLFHRAIMQSVGYDGITNPLPFAEARGRDFATAAGCAPADAACLRALPVDRILSLQARFIIAPVSGVPDLPEPLPVALPAGRFNRVPVIAGWTRDEATWQTALTENAAGKPSTADSYRQIIARFAADAPDPSAAAARIARAYPLNAFRSPGQAIAAITTDYGFICPTRRMMRALTPWVPVHGYEFADRTAPHYNDPGSFPFGAAHTSELQYLFTGFHGATGRPQPLGAAQDRLARTMRRLWAGFAKKGSPGISDIWSRYRPARNTLLILDLAGPRMVPAAQADARHCEIWDDRKG